MSGLKRTVGEKSSMFRFPVAGSCPARSASPPGCSDHDRLDDAELRTEALLRDAVRGVRQGRVEIDEVAANFGADGAPILDISLAVRGLDGNDPCFSLCRLLNQLLTRLTLQLEGAGQ